MFWECKTDPMAERKEQERPGRSCYILATLVFENVNHKKKGGGDYFYCKGILSTKDNINYQYT